MRPVKTHLFRHKRWRIHDSQYLRDGTLGECRYEDSRRKCPVLYIPTRGGTLEALDTIVHEALHACVELDEHGVSQTATSIAGLLWRLGWRKQDL